MMIDWEQVTALRDQVGADDMDEVIDLFIEEVEAVTNRLRTDITLMLHSYEVSKQRFLSEKDWRLAA